MIGQRGDFYLGGLVDPDTGARTGDKLIHAARDLTTHGVIVGMTGSGKTGLGVVLLEEALLSGVPVLVLDPKGDMGNLLLNFPDLSPADFQPWVDPAEARRKGVDLQTLSASVASAWRKGLASWGIETDRLQRLREGVAYTLYTPGSRAGVPLNLLGALAAPGAGTDVEIMREEIEGLVSSLLAIAGLDPDPLSSPEHIFLSNLIEHLWNNGRDLDLGHLIRFVQDPPIRKLGVFSLDEFFPEEKRRELAMRLNALMASPSFASWLEGQPLDLDAMIRSTDGRPGASIVYLAHLSDAERQFVVTLLLTRVITWMRQQPGTSDLRLLIYMDEMFGFAPPTAQPPSKRPILTIFKQARAHGVGMVVSTQNPVDLDYKVISNAGTWMLGRLQTDRDKARVLEGLTSASGAVDLKVVDGLLSGLDKRQFVFRTARSAEPVVFTTRWAMSYLRGALTREEVEQLVAGKTSAAEASGTPAGSLETNAPQAPRGAPVAHDESPLEPKLPTSVPVYHLDPAAPWASEVGAVPGSLRLEPALVARLRIRFDDRYAEVDHTEEWERIYYPLMSNLDPKGGLEIDYDDRDLRREGPEDARFVLGHAPITTEAFWRDFQRRLKALVYQEGQLTILRNPELKLHARPGEDRGAFLERCRKSAEEGADEEVAGLRDTYEKRIDRLEDALARAESRVRELEVDVASRKQQELVAGAGKLISMFLKGRASASGLSSVASRRSMTRRTEERLRSARQRQLNAESDLEAMEEELLEEIRKIVEEWADRVNTIEDMEIRLEKDDIAVDQVGLLWIPV
mgnify:CR=1 FL=1